MAQDFDTKKMEGSWYTIYLDKEFFAGYEPQCLKYDVSVAPGSMLNKGCKSGESVKDSDSSSDDEQEEDKEFPDRET